MIYLLDTDHVSVLQRGGDSAAPQREAIMAGATRIPGDDWWLYALALPECLEGLIADGEVSTGTRPAGDEFSDH